MTLAKKGAYITVDEYLANEERSQVKHEYIDGRIFAMIGVTRRHNVISGNIYTLLRAHLKGTPCRAYMSDVKARVEAANSFYYPDVMVSCDRYDEKSVYTDSPVLIVEVLSRSTAVIDRREKVIAYRQIASLMEYLIVHQTRRQVELHRRNENGGWDIFQFDSDASEIVLTSIPVGTLKISMDEIYEDVGQTDGGALRVREETEDEWLDEGALSW